MGKLDLLFPQLMVAKLAGKLILLAVGAVIVLGLAAKAGVLVDGLVGGFEFLIEDVGGPVGQAATDILAGLAESASGLTG